MPSFPSHHIGIAFLALHRWMTAWVYAWKRVFSIGHDAYCHKFPVSTRRVCDEGCIHLGTPSLDKMVEIHLTLKPLQNRAPTFFGDKPLGICVGSFLQSKIENRVKQTPTLTANVGESYRSEDVTRGCILCEPILSKLGQDVKPKQLVLRLSTILSRLGQIVKHCCYVRATGVCAVFCPGAARARHGAAPAAGARGCAASRAEARAPGEPFRGLRRGRLSEQRAAYSVSDAGVLYAID